MRVIEEKDLLPYITGRDESRNLEFKPGFVWNDLSSRKIQEEVIKAVIALSNTPQGGDIVLGIKVKAGNSKIILEGVQQTHIKYFTDNYEKVEQEIHKYCSRTPRFEIVSGSAHVAEEMKDFILIRVEEYFDMPILTIEHGKEKEDNGKSFVISSDTLYIRTQNAPWSSRKATYREFEETITYAADKLRRQLKMRGYIKLDDLDVKLKEERADYE